LFDEFLLGTQFNAANILVLYLKISEQHRYHQKSKQSIRNGF
jgi:hypothetical protein